MNPPVSPDPLPPDKHDNPNQLDELAKRLEVFKLEVAQNRDRIRNKGQEYLLVTKDEEYELLRQKSTLVTEEDFLNLSHYPFHTTLRQREQQDRNQVEDPEFPTVDFDKIEKKVYKLKAFEEQAATEEIVQPLAGPRRARILSERDQQRAREALNRSRQDLEQYLYENVIGKIGVVVLTLGLGILVRHGINIGVLGELERVLVGTFAAGLLFYLGYRNIVNNETMSILYSAAGLSILYYTSYLSYAEYAFLPQLGAMAFKIGITGASIYLAFYYDHRFFALLALVGIYLTPFLIRADEVNYGLFFTYLLAMNAGMIVVGYIKQWQSVDDLTFVTTVIVFGSWLYLMRLKLGDESIFVTGFLFATLFYLLFFLMFIVHSLRRVVTEEGEVALSERDYWLFVINDILYFLAIYLLLEASSLTNRYFGLFMLGFGLFNGIYAWILYRNPQKDAKLLRYLIVVALISLTATAPFLFKSTSGRHAYWLLETVGLIWLAQAGKLQLLRDFSAFTLALSLVALSVVWHRAYWLGSEDFLFNLAGQSTGLTIIGLVGCILLLLKRDKTEMVLTFTVESYIGLLGGLALLLFYATGNIELYKHNIFNREYQRLLIGIYNSVFALALGVVSERIHVTVLKKVARWSLIAAVLSYIVFVHLGVVDLRNLFLQGRAPLYTFVTHYFNLVLGIACLFTLAYSEYQKIRAEATQLHWDYALWFVGFGVVFFATAEFDHHLVVFLYNNDLKIDDILNNSRLFGYTLLWPLCAFAFLLIGTRYQLKDFRMLSLFILGATLVKFGVYDFWRINVLGRILSTLFIGSLLLVVSYLYGQLRELVLAGSLDMGLVVEKLTGGRARKLWFMKQPTNVPLPDAPKLGPDTGDGQDPAPGNEPPEKLT